MLTFIQIGMLVVLGVVIFGLYIAIKEALRIFKKANENCDKK